MLAVFALLGASASVAEGGRDPWLVARARLSYSLYEPTQRLGTKLSSFRYLPCYRGKSRDSLYTTFGSYNMLPNSRARGFELVEGSPEVCANAAQFTHHGTRTIGGIRASLGVYCEPPKRCSLVQGFRNGYTLYWTRGKTFIQINSAHLTLAQLLRVAESLRLVG